MGGNHITLGLLDMKRHQLLEAVADRQIGRYQLVRQFGAAADDQEVALVVHQPLDQVVVETQHDHHVGVRAAGLVDLVGIYDDEFAGYQLVLRSLQKEACISVQNIDQLQGIVPMRRQVFAGRPIFQEDPLFADVVVLHINVFRHSVFLLCGVRRLFVPIYH